MTAPPQPTDIATLFSTEALAALRARPDFRGVVEELIAEGLAHYRGLDQVGRWMFADIGRTALYTSTVVLDALPGGVTVAALAASAEGSRASSRGRVAQFIRFAQDAGEIAVPAGHEHWTRRRLILRPAFIERLRQRGLVQARAAAKIAPEIEPLIDALSDEAIFRRFLSWGAALSTPERMVGPTTPVTMFLRRHSGLRILNHLTLAQSQNRAHLLEEAPLSRNQLSQLYGVSRAHINRLLADATAQGLLHCPSPQRVVFSPQLSDDFERTMAFLIQLTRAQFVAAFAVPPTVGQAD
jgi:hypothetical protein